MTCQEVTGIENTEEELFINSFISMTESKLPTFDEFIFKFLTISSKSKDSFSKSSTILRSSLLRFLSPIILFVCDLRFGICAKSFGYFLSHNAINEAFFVLVFLNNSLHQFCSATFQNLPESKANFGDIVTTKD